MYHVGVEDLSDFNHHSWMYQFPFGWTGNCS